MPILPLFQYTPIQSFLSYPSVPKAHSGILIHPRVNPWNSALRVIREISTGYGYSSSQPAVAHFGLGNETHVDIQVTMPFGGPVYTESSVPVNRVLLVGTEFISFTIIDYGGTGIIFGDLDPGETGPADGDDVQESVTIIIGAETNVDVDIQVKGEEFSGTGGNIPINWVIYDEDDNPTGSDNLTGTYETWYQIGAGTYNERQVYYWITIPPDQPAGEYTSTFYYEAIKSE